MKTQVIHAKTMVDGTGSAPVQNPVVVVEGSKIVQVGTEDTIRIPDESRVNHLWYTDSYLLPGLINCHAHLIMPGNGTTIESWADQSNEVFSLTAANNAALALKTGVTTLRDCGSRDRVTFELRKATEMGTIKCPRLLLCGRPITIIGGHLHPFHCEVNGIWEMRKAVRRLMSEGADFIKIIAAGGGTKGSFPQYTSFTIGELKAAVEEAHRHGKKVTAHCITTHSTMSVVEAGVDGIEHIGLNDPKTMTLDYDEKIVQSIVEAGITITPTLQVGRETITNLESRGRDLNVTEREHLRKLNERLEFRYEICSRLLDDGITFLAGSDAGWNYCTFDTFFMELKELTNGGMTSSQAIMAATGSAAQALGIDDFVGTIEVGKEADLLLVDGDPLGDILDLQKTEMVMLGGDIV